MKYLTRLIICLVVCSLSFSFQKTSNDPAAAIRKQLYSATNWIADGKTPSGTTVKLGFGLIDLGTTPLYVTSEQNIEGLGTGTVLKFNGPVGTAAIQYYTPLTHHNVHNSRISNLCIWCPNGAMATSRDTSVAISEHIVFDTVYFNGGGINFPGENYEFTVDNCKFVEQLGKAIRVDGRVNRIRSIHLTGQLAPNTKPPEEMIDLRGDFTFEGNDWFEGDFGCTLIKVSPFGGQMGRVRSTGDWTEPHTKGVPTTWLDDSIWWGEPQGNLPPDHPWKLTGRAAVRFDPVQAIQSVP